MQVLLLELAQFNLISASADYHTTMLWCTKFVACMRYHSQKKNMCLTDSNKSSRCNVIYFWVYCCLINEDVHTFQRSFCVVVSWGFLFLLLLFLAFSQFFKSCNPVLYIYSTLFFSSLSFFRKSFINLSNFSRTDLCVTFNPQPAKRSAISVQADPLSLVPALNWYGSVVITSVRSIFSCSIFQINSSLDVSSCSSETGKHGMY